MVLGSKLLREFSTEVPKPQPDPAASEQAQEQAKENQEELQAILEILAQEQEANSEAGLRTWIDLEDEVANDVEVGELKLDNGRVLATEYMEHTPSDYAIAPARKHRLDILVHGDDDGKVSVAPNGRLQITITEKAEETATTTTTTTTTTTASDKDGANEAKPATPILIEVQAYPVLPEPQRGDSVATLALVQVEPPRPNAPTLPSACTSLTPMALLEAPPANALVIGLSSGSALTSYFQHVLPFCHLDVVEHDSQRLARAKNFLAFPDTQPTDFNAQAFKDTAAAASNASTSEQPVIDHPLFQNLSTYRGGFNLFTGISPMNFIEGLFPGHPAATSGSTLPGREVDSSSLTLVDRITPIRAYNFLAFDTGLESCGFDSPTAISCIHDAIAPGGVFVRRFPLVRRAGSKNGWGLDVDAYLGFLAKAFPHVYWAQPSADSFVVVGVRGQGQGLEQVLGSNPKYSHPVSPEKFTDLAVALWEAHCMDLSVVEKADSFKYYDPKSHESVASQLLQNPEDFLL